MSGRCFPKGRAGPVIRALLAALMLAAPPLAAQAPEADAPACQLPSALMGLAQALSALPERSGPVAVAQRQALEARLARLSERRILRQMEEAGLESLSLLAVDLMSEARLIADTGRQHHGEALQALLQRLEQEVVVACAASETALYQSDQQERLGRFIQRGEAPDWTEMERRLQENPALSVGVLVVAMLAVVAVLCLADFATRWIMALIWNRKACRIPCELHLGDRAVEGQVVTLGRGGCRIHPLDMARFQRMAEALQAAPATLYMGGKAMTLRAAAFHEEVADFRFEVPLSLRLHRALLRHSTISPYYIRKTRDGGVAATRALYQQPGGGG